LNSASHLLPLESLLWCVVYVWDRVSQTICPDYPWTFCSLPPE
jgi:hypothetical protein